MSSQDLVLGVVKEMLDSRSGEGQSQRSGLVSWLGRREMHAQCTSPLGDQHENDEVDVSTDQRLSSWQNEARARLRREGRPRRGECPCLPRKSGMGSREMTPTGERIHQTAMNFGERVAH